MLGTVMFNVPVNILQVISCHSTKGKWSGQSHQALSTLTVKYVTKKMYIYSTMKTKDTEAHGRQS